MIIQFNTAVLIWAEIRMNYVKLFVDIHVVKKNYLKMITSVFFVV